MQWHREDRRKGSWKVKRGEEGSGCELCMDTRRWAKVGASAKDECSDWLQTLPSSMADINLPTFAEILSPPGQNLNRGSPLVYGPKHLIKISELENNWLAAVKTTFVCTCACLSTHKQSATPGRLTHCLAGSVGTLMFLLL